MSPSGPRPRSFASVVDGAMARREHRRNQKQPWLALKTAVGLCVAIIGYTAYVYIGRVCVPMIRREHNALGSRALGIGFLAVFVLLLFMMLWAYIKVLFTPPGFANKYVKKVSATDPQESTHIDSTGPSPPRLHGQPNMDSGLRFDDTLGIPYYVTRKPSEPGVRDQNEGAQWEVHSAPSDNPVRTDVKPRDATARTPSASSTRTPSASTAQEKPAPPPVLSAPSHYTPRTYALDSRTRAPSSVPVLRPEYRYCRRCSIVKPARAHHCRACGKCVLKYDHHCPWIGQCVGARNHKFFLVFVVWAALFCCWTLGSLVGLVAAHGGNIDPQHIVAIVLAGLFALFTLSMFITHTAFISGNMSTVEHMNARGMRERESDVLAEMYPWYAFREKRRTRKEWDAEWGRIGKEGNVWWTGSVRRHWEEVLGPNVWTWFLPVGKSPSDGLHYERNPRFDADGRWMPRSAWPEALR